MNHYEIEITDTFGGEANYSWLRRHSFAMPEMTYYGYDGSQGYCKAAKTYRRELVKRAKALAGWTGARCEVSDFGDTIEIRPRGACVVAFVTWKEGEDQ
jgi:hypothetical protein